MQEQMRETSIFYIYFFSYNMSTHSQNLLGTDSNVASRLSKLIINTAEIHAALNSLKQMLSV